MVMAVVLQCTLFIQFLADPLIHNSWQVVHVHLHLLLRSIIWDWPLGIGAAVVYWQLGSCHILTHVQATYYFILT